jgi:hypothetical protein
MNKHLRERAPQGSISSVRWHRVNVIIIIIVRWHRDHFGEPWPVRLTAEPKTSDLGDEIYATIVLATDDSWEGIRRIPGLPSIAAQLVNSVAATKIEEAVSLIQYAWGASWPVRGTIALTMNYGTERAW